MKHNKGLDQFFTKSDVASICYNVARKTLANTVDLDRIQFLEPSAGSGSFYDVLPKGYITFRAKKYRRRLGYDIDPKKWYIKQKDFLLEPIEKELLLPSENIIVIGNPPFGKRSRLAVAFFNKAGEYSNTISFIVPLQFRKWSVQSKLDTSFRLIRESCLDKNSFVFNGKDYSVRTVFQVWTRLKTKHKNLRILTKPAVVHTDFDMWQYNNTDATVKYFDKNKYNWDFAVVRQGFYNYRELIIKPENMSLKKQWIFFRAGNKKTLTRLKKLDFEKLASKNTSIPGFGKADVVEEYSRIYGEGEVLF